MPVLKTMGLYLVCCAALAPVWPGPTASAQEVSLAANHQAGAASRVTLTLVVDGKLRQVSQTAAKHDEPKPAARPEPAELALKVTGRLMYDEVLGPRASPSDRAQQSARFYHHAEASIEVGGRSERIHLSDEHRFIVSDATDQPILYGVDGPLTREELDLIVVPGNSLVADRLLPDRSVRISDRWSNDGDTIAGMLNWTELNGGEITSQLEEVSNGLARVSIAGTVRGLVDGAESEASIRGEYRYDLNWHRLTWLSLTLRETRQSGPIHPGFEVTAELRMRIEPLRSSRHITADMLHTAWSARSAAQMFLSLKPQGSAFTLTHDRRWHVARDMPRRTILRCLDDGELLAQLTVTQLARLPDGRELSLEALQAEIQAALGDRFHEFISARKSITPADYRLLRIEAAGMVAEVPIRWIYYHINDSSGRRAAHVYTLAAEKLALFGATDEEIVSGFRFRNKSTANQSAARKPSRRSSAPRSR